jgi:hypothetical protein
MIGTLAPNATLVIARDKILERVCFFKTLLLITLDNSTLPFRPGTAAPFAKQAAGADHI